MNAAGPLSMLQPAPAPVATAAGEAAPAATEAGAPFAFLLTAEPASATPAPIDAGALVAALFGSDEPVENTEAADGATDSPLLLWLPWMMPSAAEPADGSATPMPCVPGVTTAAVPALSTPATAADGVLASLGTPSTLDATMLPLGTVGAGGPNAAGMSDPAAELAQQLASIELLAAGAAGDAVAEAVDTRTPDAATTTRGAARPAFELVVPTSPAQRFADALAEGVEGRLEWMAEQGVGRARIRLSPAELGTIDIQLQLDGKQVRAEFSSANADVRQVLESQLPRLREMFLSQGMTLTQADVGHRHEAQDGQAGHRDGNGIDGDPAGVDTDLSGMSLQQVRHRIGLLDEYA